ncbi:hypothetical protein Gogos_020292 [Gossypium gossypioides]|uniref:Uncharacterized protein n=1 Tax=Gossypium gossypioides TaxID=34282 RepID=A0A7J9CX23_GOSGO|nr:hypothetical protein [Gossypium gossypioides]
MMDIMVIGVKLGLLVNIEENVRLVPVVDTSMIVQNLIKICFLNLGEIEVNLELHQNEKPLYQLYENQVKNLTFFIYFFGQRS